jgi:predicted DNA-binding transcriptional regulator AlpA
MTPTLLLTESNHLLRPEELMGSAEVCDALHVPRSTVMRWLRRDAMPRPVTALRATPVWRREDIENFQKERQACAT